MLFGVRPGRGGGLAGASPSLPSRAVSRRAADWQCELPLLGRAGVQTHPSSPLRAFPRPSVNRFVDSPAAALAPDLMPQGGQVPEELLRLFRPDPLTDPAHTSC